MAVIIEGLKQVQDALAKYLEEQARQRAAAFTRIAAIIKTDAVKNAPIDTGNLRGSAYSEADSNHAEIGFSASYAAYVHEQMEVNRGEPRTSGTGKGRYWDGGGPKFLSRAVQKNFNRITEELKKGMDK